MVQLIIFGCFPSISSSVDSDALPWPALPGSVNCVIPSVCRLPPSSVWILDIGVSDAVGCCKKEIIVNITVFDVYEVCVFSAFYKGYFGENFDWWERFENWDRFFSLA